MRRLGFAATPMGQAPGRERLRASGIESFSFGGPTLILAPGDTCWRLARASRAAVLVDMADYYRAAWAAMSGARRSVHLLNWAFEPQTPFDPPPGAAAPAKARFGQFLKDLARARPEVDVRLLCWKSALPVAATMDFFPQRDRRFFAGSAVKFVLDGNLPLGACHHQKVIVIDDEVAFCGGGDIAPDRWDTPEHRDDDPRRRKKPSDRRSFPSRHEVMALVEGAPAAALGDLFRERWRRATGEIVEARTGAGDAAWPAGVEPHFADVVVGLSRTMAAWSGGEAVREADSLTFASVAQATRSIYLENQYFTSPILAEALAARLAEPGGPEVILVGPRHSPSWFDQITMDRTRRVFIKRLERADVHGRLRVLAPVTAKGRTIIVHAKLAIIDDRLLRVGSANMNNRSAGFDTECDLSFEAEGGDEAAARSRIAAIRTALLAHWLGCSTGLMAETIKAEGALGAAIDALRRGGLGRLRPLAAPPLGPVARFIAAFHIGDPVGPADSWRPWRRRRQLRLDLARLIARLEARVGSPDEKGPPGGGPVPEASKPAAASMDGLDLSTHQEPART